MRRPNDIWADIAIIAFALLVALLAGRAVASWSLLCPPGEEATCWLRQRPEAIEREIHLPPLTIDGGSKCDPW